MVILIDGYNLLKNIAKTDRATDKQIDQFIALLSTYARISQHELIVVFDAGPDVYVTKEKRNGITIVYSGTRESADPVIERYLDEFKNKDILLVSTDRELDAYARERGIEFVDSYPFYQLMQQRLNAGPTSDEQESDQLVKTTSQSDSELDALMEQASRNVMIKQEKHEHSRERSQHRLSKQEKRKQDKIKKI